MLILTRKIGEVIRINDNITVTISGIEGKNVKIGIHAPEGVKIHREEVYQKILAENKKASSNITNESILKLKGLLNK